MPSVKDIQARFEAALLGDDAGMEGLKPSSGMPVAQRFDVYRNNAMGARLRALEGLYPALFALVGDNFFTQAARDYVHQTPWQSGNLLTFGLDFGAFLRAYPPAQGHAYLADVADVEAAVHDAYIAAEAGPVDPAELRQIAPDAMADLRFDLHPSARFLNPKTPATRIWEAALTPDMVDGPIDPDGGGEYLLIIRPGADVEVRRLDAAGYTFIGALKDRATLGNAYRKAMAVTPDFDLTQALEAHLSGGSFAAFS